MELIEDRAALAPPEVPPRGHCWRNYEVSQNQVPERFPSGGCAKRSWRLYSVLFGGGTALRRDSDQLGWRPAHAFAENDQRGADAASRLRSGRAGNIREEVREGTAGLAEGDSELQLPATSDPEILSGLATVRQTWEPIRGALEQTLANPDKTDATLAPVLAGNMALLADMDKVVRLFEQRARDKVGATLRMQIAIAAILTGLLFLAWLIVLRKVIRPLAVAVDDAGKVSAGDLTGELDAAFRDRRDEIGDLARAMQTMSASLRTMIREISAKTRVLLSSSSDLRANAAQMSSGSRDTSDRAHSVAAAAEQMSVNVTSVAAGMEQTTTNLGHVAMATGEMTSTIGEIAGNSAKARHITGEATRQAKHITEQIGRLSKAANEIGRVTETITEISSQTNLLALNATIEAARAGSAGKGFAVVANEIKALAQQAAAVTDDIKTRIATIQSASADGVAEVDKISHVISEVSEIVTSIAAAIEQQAGVTKTIAQNIAEATLGVKDVNVRVAESSQASRAIAEDIAAVDRVAGDMAAGSDNIRTNAVELAGVSEQLQTTVARFCV
jgi:methyl-accepting chemotaxis protein